MPIQNCHMNGKPGYKWGNSGKCYTYDPNSPASRKEAKKKAIKQGIAIEGPDKFKQKVANENTVVDITLADMLNAIIEKDIEGDNND